MKKFKKLVAIAMTAAMTLGTGFTSLAASTGTIDKEGDGAVEYDNSADITYDSVTLPTIPAGSTIYDLILDPQKMLYDFDPVTYSDAAATVLFQNNLPAEIDVANSNNGDIFLESMTEVAAGSYTGLVEEVSLDSKNNVTGVVTVTDGYSVWTPEEVSGSYTGKGTWVELTASNVLNYFDVTATAAKAITAVTAKSTYKSGTDLFDGKLYQKTYTKATGNLKALDYVTLDTDGETITAVKPDKLFKPKQSGGYEVVDKADLEIIKASTPYTNETDALVLTNNSTKKKVITATVTLNNPQGLVIDDDGVFTGDTSASIYVAAKGGAAPVVLAEDNGVVKAEYTVTLNPAASASSAAPNVFQASGNNALGGHAYAKYEPFDVEYSSNSFTITASANDEADAAEAWAAWAKAAAEADTPVAPKLTVSYKVEDWVEPPTDAAPTLSTTAVTLQASTAFTINVDFGAGALAATGLDGVFYNGGSADTTSNGYATFNAGTGVYTFSAEKVDTMISRGSNFTLVFDFNDEADTKITVNVSMP